MPDIARQAGGYILNVAGPRRTALLDARASGAAVAESVTNFTHRRSHPLICFVSFSDSAITHLAEGRLGRLGGTDLRRLNILNFTELRTPVRYAAVLEILPQRFRPHVETRFADGGLLPPGSFGAVVDAVRSLLPESNRLLERFSESRRRLIADLSGEARTALAYQKETVATALTLAGMERQKLQDWRPRLENGQVRSFLEWISHLTQVARLSSMGAWGPLSASSLFGLMCCWARRLRVFRFLVSWQMPCLSDTSQRSIQPTGGAE